MRTLIRTKVVAAALLGALAIVFLQAAAAPAGTKSETYKPPFKKGAQGGDEWNYVYSDPSSGQEMVLRTYPEFNPFTCGGSHGGYVSLRLPLKVKAPIRSIAVRYENALIDPYSFITVTVFDRGRNTYLGSKDVRGPLGGSGTVKVPLDLGRARPGSTLQVDFGLEVPSACPNVEAAEAEFTEVTVNHS